MLRLLVPVTGHHRLPERQAAHSRRRQRTLALSGTPNHPGALSWRIGHANPRRARPGRDITVTATLEPMRWASTLPPAPQPAHSNRADGQGRYELLRTRVHRVPTRRRNRRRGRRYVWCNARPRPNGTRPTTYTMPATVAGQTGVMVQGLAPGLHTVSAKVDSAPETVVIGCGAITVYLMAAGAWRVCTSPDCPKYSRARTLPQLRDKQTRTAGQKATPTARGHRRFRAAVLTRDPIVSSPTSPPATSPTTTRWNAANSYAADSTPTTLTGGAGCASGVMTRTPPEQPGRLEPTLLRPRATPLWVG